MGEKSGREQAFLPLTEASYCIMAALGEPRHGYGIMQAVAETSGGTVRLGPGTLYGALTKMLRQALIRRVGEVEKDGERRKLYVLTDLGRAVVDLESARLDALSRMGGRLLKRKGEDNV